MKEKGIILILSTIIMIMVLIINIIPLEDPPALTLNNSTIIQCII